MKTFICFSVLLFCSMSYGQPGLGFSYRYESFVNEGGYNEYEYFIEYVFTKSPAEQAGLQAGDRVIRFDKVWLETKDNFTMANIVKNSPDVVEITVARKGVEQTFHITKADKSTYLNICLKGNCTNGSGTFVDAQGTYVGTFKDGKKDGKGKQTATNGDFYDGQWKNGQREGKGTYNSILNPYRAFSTGWKYEGDWKADAMSGKGKLSYNGGNYYEGDLLNNLREGFGKLVDKDNTVYEGTWKSDKLNGQGTILYANGDKITGTFLSGKLEGEVMTYTKATNTTSKAQYVAGVKKP